MIFKNQLNIKYWIAVDIFITSFLIIELVLGLISIPNNMIDPRYQIHYIKQKEISRPLMGIQLKDGDNPCPEDTTLLVFDMWPGLIEGCDCRHLSDKKRILRHKCTNDLLQKGCERISKIASKPITKWRETEFCVKYSNERNFNRPVQYPSRCEIVCGLYIEDIYGFFCPYSQKECPINDIVINDEPQYYSSHGILYETIKLASLNDASSPLYLHSTNQATYNFLISSFAISDGQICSNPFAKDIKIPYILDPYFYDSSCNNTYDKSISAYSNDYNFIDYIKTIDMLNENDISIPNNIEYTTHLESEVFLYTKKLVIQNYDRTINSYKFIYFIEAKFLWEIHIIGVALTLFMQLLLITYKVLFRYNITTCYNWFELTMIFFHLFNLIPAMIAKITNNSYSYLHYRIGEMELENIMKMLRHSLVNIVGSFICIFLYPSDVVLNCWYVYRKEVLGDDEEKEKIKKEL